MYSETKGGSLRQQVVIKPTLLTLQYELCSRMCFTAARCLMSCEEVSDKAGLLSVYQTLKESVGVYWLFVGFVCPPVCLKVNLFYQICLFVEERSRVSIPAWLIVSSMYAKLT